MDITNLIGETTQYEIKRIVERKKVSSWLKSVSAFSNTVGGKLIFGIDDNDILVGLENFDSDYEFISRTIKEKINPVPQFKLSIFEILGKKIIIVDISIGDDTPYYYKGHGSTLAYIRIGNESVVAESSELRRLVLNGKNITYDTQISQFKREDFSFTKLKERYKIWTNNSFSEKMFFSFGIIDKNDNLTNVGALLADESQVYQSRLFCTRWNGLNKAGA